MTRLPPQHVLNLYRELGAQDAERQAFFQGTTALVDKEDTRNNKATATGVLLGAPLGSALGYFIGGDPGFALPGAAAGMLAGGLAGRGLSHVGEEGRFEAGMNNVIGSAMAARNAYFDRPDTLFHERHGPLEVSGPEGEAVAKKVAFWATEYMKTAIWNGWNSWQQSPILQATGLAPATTKNTVPAARPKTFSLDGTVAKGNQVSNYTRLMSDATKKKLPGYGLGPKVKIVGFGR